MKIHQRKFKSLQDNIKMFLNFKEIIFFASFLFVYAKDESLNMRQIKEDIAKTSIVTYKKTITSEENALSFLNELKNDSGLKVEHLPNVGAFLITYHDMERMGSRKRSLLRMVDDFKMTFDEDDYVTFPEDPSLRDVDIQVPDEPEEDLPNDRDGIDILVPDEPEEDLPNDRTLDQTIPPKDVYFYDQWALQKLSNEADINAQEGWAAYIAATNGATDNEEVIVAVIDTGVKYDHEDLKDVMWQNPGEIAGNGIDDDKNGFVDDVYGVDFLNNPYSGDPYDKVDDHVDQGAVGHGTHCAGIIAAKENSAKGIAGVASYTNGKVYIFVFG